MKPSFPLSLVVVFASLVLATASVCGAGLQMLQGQVPPAARTLTPLSRLPASQQLNLAIALPLRNAATLSNLLQQIYNPASPSYHHYLTPAEFAGQFGPTEQDYQAVIAFAKANHLQVTAIHPNRVLLDVSGTAADVEKALHITLHTYQHPTEHRLFYAPDTEPSLDLGIPILHISGLDNYALPRPHLQATRITQSQNELPNAGSGPSGTYMGLDFRAAYVPDTTLNGSGQVVGLLQFDGYTASDIAYYENKAGLQNVPLQNVLLDGFSGNPTGSGGEVEVSLDIEMTISMATNLSKVIVYEAGPYGSWHDILNRMANDNLAKQLSCSWYIPNGGADATADQIFQQMAAQGQSFFNASGDNDAYTGLISFPGDSPYITQVGGTTLTTTGPGGTWVSEKVWNWGTGIGSGGGISTQYPIPTWQTNISMTANQGSTTMRNTPDVALTADNVYVRADGSDYNVGGTSCAAPLWAGFAALVNQQAAGTGQPAIGFINPAVDAIGSGVNYTTAFHDITTGNNTSSSSPNKFYAVTGYDLCTGWGAPAGQNLINALANPEALVITPLTGFTAVGGVGGPFFPVASQDYSLTNIGTNTLTWTLSNTSAWLTVSSTSGTLNPDSPSATVTVSLNNAASNLVVGTYGATILFTNQNDNIGQGRQFTLSVIAPPSITQQPTNQAVLEGATATFNVQATGGLPLVYQWQFNGTNLTDGGNISGSATTSLTIADVSATDVGAFTVVVTNFAGMVTSSNAVLTIVPSPPVIVVQPTNEIVAIGSTARLSVGIIGSTPFSFQWSFNGTNLDGATNAVLTLANAQFDNAGVYAVFITNSLGSVLSSNATLTVVPCDPPPAGLTDWWQAEGNALDIITGSNGVVEPGTTFTTGMVGQCFSFDGTNGCVLNDSSPSLTDIQNSFTIEFWAYPKGGLVFYPIDPNGLNNGGGLQLAVFPEFGGSGGQAGVGIGVGTNGISVIEHAYNYLPTLLNYTNSLNGWVHVALVYSNKQPSLYVNGAYVATGITSPRTFVYPSKDFGGQITSPWNRYGPYAGLLDEISIYNRSLTPAEIAAIYTAGSAGKCFTPTPPMITAQPVSQTNAVGSTATFSVTASGTPPLNYQWSFNSTNIVGATNATLTLTNIQLNQTGNYFVLVTNAYGSTTSSVAVLTVYTVPPFIATQPASQTNFLGTTVSFSVTAGGTPPLSYQWSLNTTNIIGATNATLTLTDVQFSQAGDYSVLVTNPYGMTNSSVAVLTVNPVPPCDPSPAGITDWWQAEGNALDIITGSNGVVEPGATFTTGIVGQCFSFDGVSGCVLNDNSPSLASIQNSFTIEFWAYPKGGLVFYPPDPNGLNNGGGLQLAVFPEFGGSGGQAGAGIGVGTNGISVIEHAAGYLPTLLNYTNSLNGWVHVALVYSSKQPSLYVNGAYVATGITSPRTFVYPSKDFGGQITSPWNTYGPYAGLLDEISIYNRVLTPSEIAAIYAAGSGGKCFTPTPPTITAQPANQTNVVGSTATFGVAASGTPPLYYQWSFDTTNINGATNATLTLTSVQFSQAGNYSVLVSNAYGSTNSSVAVLSVYGQPPFITVQPTSQTNFLGTTASFSVTAGGTPPLSYQWSFNTTNIIGATNASLTLHNVQLSQAGNYSVLVANPYGSTNSSVAVLAVNPAPPCDPPPASLTDWWQAEGNALDFITGSNGVVGPGTTFTTGMVGQCFSFDGASGCVLNDNTPSLSTSIQNSFTIEFWAYPKGNMIFYPPNTNGLYNGGGLQLAVFPEFGGSSGQAGVGVGVGTNGISVIEHAYNYLPVLLNYTNFLNGWVHVALVYSNKQPSLYVNGVYAATGITSPRTFVYPSKDFGSQTTYPWNTYGPYAGLLDEISIFNRSLTPSEIAAIYAAGNGGKCTSAGPVIATQPTNQTVMVGSNASFSVIAGSISPLSYQWNFNGTNISGATNATLVLTNVQPGQAGNYAVQVTNLYGSAVSSNATLTVVDVLDHFAWNPVSSPRFVKAPFSVTVQAMDPANQLFTNFTGVVLLATTNGVPVHPPGSGHFVQGAWTGSISIPQAASNLVLKAYDGAGGHVGFANPINVVGKPSLQMAQSGGFLLMFWPMDPSGFSLEYSTNLASPQWSPVTAPPLQVGDQWLESVQISYTNTVYLYRLRYTLSY